MLTTFQFQYLCKKIESLENATHEGKTNFEDSKSEPNSPKTPDEFIESLKNLEKRIEKIIEKNYSDILKYPLKVKELKGLV